MKTVLTYGTFDLFHIGHLNMLKQLSELGERLVVGVSTDEFNQLKGKKSIFSYQERKSIIESNRYVDLVIPEQTWDQKEADVKKHGADIFAIGEDWMGKFDFLKEHCDVMYLPRTPYVSTTDIKASLQHFKKEQIEVLKKSLDDVMAVVQALD